MNATTYSNVRIVLQLQRVACAYLCHQRR